MVDLNIDFGIFKNLMDNLYDEVVVWDDNYTLVYINKASYRHYGMSPEDMIGKKFHDLVKKEFWSPSVLPLVYKEKRVLSVIQKTYLGAKLKTTAVPILGRDGKLEFVVMNAKDWTEGEKNLEETVELEETDLSREIIYRSKEMEELLRLADRLTNIDSPVSIQGESGSGKSLLAKYMHENSQREGKFISINCASINEGLLESELFGYVKGAFTGAASEGKKGLIEAAHRGTLFLDEVGELSPKLQAKLLHVIQEREILPVGGVDKIKVDIKIITATNRDLKSLVKTQKFRQDLYYRLNNFELTIPALRKRRKDIIPLANFFLNEYNKKYSLGRYFTEEVLELLLEYEWPGNVRELASIVERLVITSDTETLSPKLLPTGFFLINDSSLSGVMEEDFSLESEVERHERDIVKKYYELYPSSRKLAKQLKVSQSKAVRLIKKYCES